MGMERGKGRCLAYLRCAKLHGSILTISKCLLNLMMASSKLSPTSKSNILDLPPVTKAHLEVLYAFNVSKNYIKFGG